NPLHDPRDPRYVFSDVIVRMDFGMRERTRVMFSGMLGDDRNGRIGRILDGSASRTTNRAGSVRVEMPVAGVMLVQRMGASLYQADFEDANYGILPSDRTSHRLKYVVVAGEVLIDSLS